MSPARRGRIETGYMVRDGRKWDCSNQGSNARDCKWDGVSQAVGWTSTERWRKGAKGSTGGEPVHAIYTLGRREVMSRQAEVTGGTTSEAVKVMSKIRPCALLAGIFCSLPKVWTCFPSPDFLLKWEGLYSFPLSPLWGFKWNRVGFFLNQSPQDTGFESCWQQFLVSSRNSGLVSNRTKSLNWHFPLVCVNELRCLPFSCCLCPFVKGICSGICMSQISPQNCASFLDWRKV